MTRESNLSRALCARGLRPAPSIVWWERLVERAGVAERWEYLAAGGRWRRYWRREGSVPDDAIPLWQQ